MSGAVKLSSRAEKYYQKLPKKIRMKVWEELKALESLPFPIQHRDVQPLVGDFKGFTRLRIGGYRIIFSMIEEEKIIAVVNLHLRGDGHKK